MASSAHIIAITDGQGQILEPLWLERAAAVHRQLRPMLPEAYAEKMQRVFAGAVHTWHAWRAMHACEHGAGSSRSHNPWAHCMGACMRSTAAQHKLAPFAVVRRSPPLLAAVSHSERSVQRSSR